ncbi:hypothetical protein LCGC14_1881040, partial [marine sediment metagenome]
MQKNVASQKWVVFAFNERDNTAKTGDAAQITAEISADGAAGGGNITDTNPTELEDGYYAFDITQGESNADLLLILPESSTGNIQVIGVPGAVYTTAPAINTLAIANARVNADVTAISTDTTAADNLESQYDGTGIIGDNFPATQSEIAAIGGGLAINTTMASVTVIQGSQQNLSNAATSDDSRWTGDDDGAGAEFIFLCTPADTTNIPVEIDFEGYYDEPSGSSNSASLQVYNFNSALWDTIATLTNSGVDEEHEVPLSHAHKAPGSATLETVAYTIGDVLIKFKQDVQETGNACLLIDHMLVGFVGNLVTAEEIVDEWETQSQADPTGFHVNTMEWLSTAVTLSTNNKPDVNIDEISDDQTAAATLELFTEVLENATGLIDAGTFKAGAISNAALGADALSAAKIADNAFAAEHFATNSIT